MAEKQTTQDQAARRVAALLALAEDAAKRGDLAERDLCLQKATGLQHQYAIDQVLLEKQGRRPEEIVSAEFCRESNTPLIKAKRQLIAGLARLYRGTASIGGEWQVDSNGKSKLNKRAFVQVWAHRSDLDFITQLYTSFILQMQSEMARDEKFTHEKVTNAWRVSYAHAWVQRVYWRLLDLQSQQNRETKAGGSGAELVLRSKADLVREHAEKEVGGFKRGRRMRTSDNDRAGQVAGDAAGQRADLGQKRTSFVEKQAVEQ